MAPKIVNTLSKTSGLVAVICDRDTVIAVSGGQKRLLMERRVSPALEELMFSQKMYSCQDTTKTMQIVEGLDNVYIVSCRPIVTSSDVQGVVAFVSLDEAKVSNDLFDNSIQMASLMLQSELEEF